MTGPTKSGRQLTRVNDTIMQSPLLPSNEKLLYYSIKSLVLEKRGGGNGEFAVSKETLAAMAGLSVRTIQRMLRKWRESGYLVVIEPNRFKPVKYEFLENLLMKKVIEHGSRTVSPASKEQIQSGDDTVGHAGSKVGQLDALVGQSVVKVGQNIHFGRTASPGYESQSESGLLPGQNWRTPEKDEIVKQMGQKMNEMSSDLMDQFVIDEKWLQFLTKEEYNHLVKISDDLSKNRL